MSPWKNGKIFRIDWKNPLPKELQREWLLYGMPPEEARKRRWVNATIEAIEGGDMSDEEQP